MENLAARQDSERVRSTLKTRNVLIERQRTSMRLEPEMWDALSDIAEREELSIHELCSQIGAHRRQSNMTSAVRVFIVDYYRQIAVKGLMPDLGGLLGSLEEEPVELVRGRLLDSQLTDSPLMDSQGGEHLDMVYHDDVPMRVHRGERGGERALAAMAGHYLTVGSEHETTARSAEYPG